MTPEQQAATRCIELLNDLRVTFLSEDYAVGQPVSSMSERFALTEAMATISTEFDLDWPGQ